MNDFESQGALSLLLATIVQIIQEEENFVIATALVSNLSKDELRKLVQMISTMMAI